MGSLVSNFFISLDGVVEAPDQWHFPYFNDQMGEAIGSGSADYAAFLMGREMYDQWSEFWPQQTGDDMPFAGFINNVDKYVVSSSLKDPQWTNSTVVPGDPAEIRALKERIEGLIGMSGSIRTVRWLLAEGLLDELNLMLHPIVVGKGEKLFTDGATHPLRLVKHETFETGVLNLSYVPG